MTLLNKIIENQANLMQHVLDVKRCLQNLTKDVENLKNRNTESVPSSVVEKDSKEVPDIWKFPKIGNQQELLDFENKIEVDLPFKNVCLNGLKKEIGPVTGKGNHECALMLDRLIFTNEFWSSTAWTGGRKKAKREMNASMSTDATESASSPDVQTGTSSNVQSDTQFNAASDMQSEQTSSTSSDIQSDSATDNTNDNSSEDSNSKFAFSQHVRFIDFFKQLMHYLTQATMSETEMKRFVQSRSRNAFYKPLSNRMPGARCRLKK